MSKLKRLFFVLAIGLAMSIPDASDAQTNVALEALKRLKNVDLESNPAIREAVLKMLEKTRGHADFVEIVREFKLSGYEAELVKFAQAHPTDSTGVAAMRLAMTGPGFKVIQAALDGADKKRATVTAHALGNTQSPKAAPILLRLGLDPKRQLDLRKAAVIGLVKTKPGAAGLLKAATEKKVPLDLHFTAGNALRGVHWKKMKERAAKLFPAPNARGEALPPLEELLKIKGDRVNGERVFFRTESACIQCHQVNGQGIDFGPGLSEIGTKLGPDAMFQSIIDPNGGISFGYEAWQVKMKNGGEALGLIVSETNDKLTLKVQGGISLTLKKANITGRTQWKTSLMPPSLQMTMTRGELADLVAYLSSLKKVVP